jgi:sporulation protein YlmC with PRC-barrel domain
MAGSLAKIAFVVLSLGVAPVCQAQVPGQTPGQKPGETPDQTPGQTPGKAEDHDAAGIHTEMLGAPVYAADGMLIGQVNDIAYDEEDQPKRIRMTSASVLGIGTRILEIPAGLFTVVRGAVVIDLPAEAVQTLPELVEQEEER